MVSPELERFAAALLAETSARVPLDRCQELFRASVTVDGDPREALAAALNALQVAGRIRLPAARTKHLWDRERTPPLPTYISRPRATSAEPEAPVVALHPDLARAVDLAVGARRPEGLLAADAWLKERRSSATAVPLAERSFEVFGDEKRLDEFLRTRFARRGKLDAATFTAYPVVEPFAMTPYDSASRWAVAVENLATYDSVRRAIDSTAGARPAAVIFGRGNQFVTSCASLRERLPSVRRLLYFGDVDLTGLEIARDAQLALAPDVDVVPWVDAYERTLDARAMEAATPPVDLEAAEDAARFLPEPSRRRAIALLLRGARVPQESVSLPVLRELVGRVRDPKDDAWVDASELRNHLNEDPQLDWFECFGEAQGFMRSEIDASLDMRGFLDVKSSAFEDAVVRYLSVRLDVVRDPGPALLDVMRRGASVIVGALVSDETTRTRAAPALLVRSDALRRLFPDALSEEGASRPAPALGASAWHYRVVEVGFTTLELTPAGDLALWGSKRRYVAEAFVANRALGELQGFLPEASFLLGRSWRMSDEGSTVRGEDAMSRIGRIRHDARLPDGGAVLTAVEEAVRWRRALAEGGAAWRVLPEPTREELRPNLRNDRDEPWRSSKRRIAEELQDLTRLSRVRPLHRARALRQGVPRLDDPRLSAVLLGVTGESATLIDAILAAQRGASGGTWPERVSVSEAIWRPVPSLEFFVDFETVSDLDDDLDEFPTRGGCAMIFMIGCGHVEAGQWRHHGFTANALVADEEVRLIDAWLAHMRDVRTRLGHPAVAPLVHHWSSHEATSLDRAFEVVRARHPDRGWEEPRWFDLLERVFWAQPVGVRGAFSHGLKDVARALDALGLISSRWPNGGVADGVGAMVGAWSAERWRKENGGGLRGAPVMQDIERYNEADCRALHEVLTFLRRSS